MLWLLGPVQAVTAHLDWVDLPEGRTDAGFVVDLLHASGVRSYVESSKLNHVAERRLRALGSAGSYQVTSTDVQAQAALAGSRPAEETVPSEQGRYHDLYTQFAAAVRGEAPEPVPAAEGVRTLAILDAARSSALRGLTVEVEDAG